MYGNLDKPPPDHLIVALAERLNRITPGTGEKRSFFVNSGAEAVENAVKVARAQWTAAKSAGCPVTYWQQSPAGKWERKA